MYILIHLARRRRKIFAIIGIILSIFINTWCIYCSCLSIVLLQPNTNHHKKKIGWKKIKKLYSSETSKNSIFGGEKFSHITGISNKKKTLCFKKERNKGGGFIKRSKSPDFGPFALEIWPKNTTNFPAAFGGQKGAKQGGTGKNTRNITDRG